MLNEIKEKFSKKYIHVMVQGVGKESIFYSDVFKEKYIKLLYSLASEMRLEIVAFVVMDNHAHLIIEKRDDLSIYMQKVDIVYSKFYNRLKDRVGHVFRGTPVFKEINDEQYLINCIAYIHNNPVNAGICKLPSEYKYSSFKMNSIFAKIDKLLETRKKNSVKWEDYLDNYLRNAYKFKGEEKARQLGVFVVNAKDRYGKSLRQIAENLGISREKIRLIYNRLNGH